MDRSRLVSGIALLAMSLLGCEPTPAVDERTVAGVYRGQLLEAWVLPMSGESCLRGFVVDGSAVVRFSVDREGISQGVWEIPRARRVELSVSGPVDRCPPSTAVIQRWEGKLEGSSNSIVFRSDRDSAGLKQSLAFNGPIERGIVDGTLVFANEGVVNGTRVRGAATMELRLR
jgi:hypothetical protein